MNVAFAKTVEPKKSKKIKLSKEHPVKINRSWKDLGVKVSKLEYIIDSYFQHPYRYNYDNPNFSVSKLNQYYFATEGADLPNIVKVEIENHLARYQSQMGKQSGFENTTKLATQLPKKKPNFLETASY